MSKHIAENGSLAVNQQPPIYKLCDSGISLFILALHDVTSNCLFLVQTGGVWLFYHESGDCVCLSKLE